MIVLGLGSGRTGTASLSQLINSQHGAICFHELNPTGVVFEGNPQPIINTITEFERILDGGDKRLLSIDYGRLESEKKYRELQACQKVRIIGDIAYYYLKYVDDILAVTDNIRFVCIKRDRGETIISWLAKSAINRWPSLWIADRFKSLVTRTPFHVSKNFWQVHDGTKWQLDPVWDKTFPKFAAHSKKEAIGRYWDYYYEEAGRLQEKHPQHFRIFPIQMMSSREGQGEILQFVGITGDDMVLKEEFHAHKRATGKVHL